MPKGWKFWVIWGVAQLALTPVVKVLLKLLENAALGWGDEQIALALGLSSPTAATVIAWGIPFCLAATILFAYHIVQTKWVASRAPPHPSGDEPTSPAQFAAILRYPNEVSQVLAPEYDPVTRALSPFSPPMMAPSPEVIAKVQNEMARAAAKMPHSQEPMNLNLLYGKNSREVWLKFAPDTACRNKDAFLLILYGYKVLKTVDEVSAKRISIALAKADFLHSPRRTILKRLTPLYIDVDEIARDYISLGLVKKRRLSEGGYFSITERGMIQAGALADDLVKRA